MKLVLVLISLFSVAFATDEFCYNDVVSACSLRGSSDLLNCDAKYGAINEVLSELQAFVNSQITYSFQYLLIATHFGNYKEHRLGFEKLFRELSDTTWNDAIELIKYITSRGGHMNFTEPADVETKDDAYEIGELTSLAKALDITKALNKVASNIHGAVTRRRENLHDPEVSSHIENFFLEKYRQSIRQISGHTSDLVKLLDKEESSLALFLFDEYLQDK